jgi:hypothetical protein
VELDRQAAEVDSGGMRTFFKPTRVKILLTVLLIVTGIFDGLLLMAFADYVYLLSEATLILKLPRLEGLSFGLSMWLTIFAQFYIISCVLIFIAKKCRNFFS